MSQNGAATTAAEPLFTQEQLDVAIAKLKEEAGDDLDMIDLAATAIMPQVSLGLGSLLDLVKDHLQGKEDTTIVDELKLVAVTMAHVVTTPEGQTVLRDAVLRIMAAGTLLEELID